MRLFSINIIPILLWKVRIQLLFFQLWVGQTELFKLYMATRLREKKTDFRHVKLCLKIYFVSHFIRLYDLVYIYIYIYIYRERERDRYRDSKRIYKYIYIVVEGHQKAPFSIATTPRRMGGRYSFPWIVSLYLRYLPYMAEC